ncbi:MAG: TfoX/Sxy family protein, partial [Steroidobacteraceae bacterium]
MTVSSDFLAYVLDQLAELGGVRSRRMFGGAGLYCDELFFGLIADDTLYLRVDVSNRADYTARAARA